MIVAAGKFKAQCLRIMDEVNKTHEPVTVTKRGKPIVRLVPPEETPPPSAFGCLAGTVHIRGDITEPLEESWHAEE